MEKEKKTLVSGIKPTAEKLHVGNYFGAIKQFVELQNDYESYIFVANYHALNQVHDAESLRSATRSIIADYLAVGLDPEKTTLFVQSDVPQVTELAWILNGFATVPYLQRAHAYKASVDKGEEVNVGTFSYPILMTADILIQDAHVVPVGQDQKQHVEIARDLAQKFNTTFGETFVVPEPLIVEEAGVVPGTDGQKMSKSYGNVIPLFALDEEVLEAIKKIPTDSRGIDEPKDVENDIVLKLHSLFTKGDELVRVREGYEKGGLSYKDSKDILFENIKTFVKPLREKRASITDADIDTVIKRGGEVARRRAEAKMQAVRKAIGLI